MFLQKEQKMNSGDVFRWLINNLTEKAIEEPLKDNFLELINSPNHINTMPSTSNLPKTIFCDIDGVLLLQEKENMCEYIASVYFGRKVTVLPGVKEKFAIWNKLGYKVILTTARPESMRKLTHKQLTENGLFYNDMIMGLSTGERHIVNDCKDNGDKAAFAHTPIRNEGLLNINI